MINKELQQMHLGNSEWNLHQYHAFNVYNMTINLVVNMLIVNTGIGTFGL